MEGDNSWQELYTVLPVQYGMTEKREIIVLYRNTESVCRVDSMDVVERRRRMAVAFHSAHSHFRHVQGGCHSVGLVVATTLINVMNISKGDVVWDIGCGVPGLAASVSAVTATQVVCTDIGGTYRDIVTAQEPLMAVRDWPKNLALLQALADNPVPAYTTKAAQRHLYSSEEEPSIRESLAAIITELEQGGTVVGSTVDQLLVPATVGASALSTRSGSTSAKKSGCANNADDSEGTYEYYRNKAWHAASNSPGLSDDHSERRQSSGFRKRVIVDEDSDSGSECGPARSRSPTSSVPERADDHRGAVLSTISCEERGSDGEGTEQATSEAAANENLPWGAVSKTQAQKAKDNVSREPEIKRKRK